jgi:MFS transporter, Spinster family, sphingosine-1-phosphate transporter
VCDVLGEAPKKMQSSRSESAVFTSSKTSIIPVVGGAHFALAVLFGMNLLNYIDRYSFFAVGTQIQRDLQVDDFWYGVLGASFMIVYTFVSPVMGWLGDRYNRRFLLAGGVGLWSLATVGTAFSRDFYHMFFWRALLGVGEASYGVIAPALLADLFPLKRRGRAMGVYYLALPLGGALGYSIGGWVGQELGWPAAFFVVGLPGLLVAAAGLVIHDPGRGASEGVSQAGKADRPRLQDYLALFRNPTFMFNTAGMATVTFATGAYAAWGSTFYQTVRGMSMKEAGAWIGGMTALAGLVGIAMGTFLADFLLRYTKRAYLLLACYAVVGAIPLGLFGVLDPERMSSLGLLFGAMVLLAMVLGPCNTVIANVVPSNQRAAGYAVYIFLIHILGDISSPIVLGAVSNLFGTPSVAASPLGRLFASIGAVPVGKTNLTVAMLVVVPVLIQGCFFFQIGSHHLAADMEKVRGTGEDESDEIALMH